MQVDPVTVTAARQVRAWLDEVGTPISVQQRAMRHGDIRVTMNVYGDPVSDGLREATAKVAARAIPQ